MKNQRSPRASAPSRREVVTKSALPQSTRRVSTLCRGGADALLGVNAPEISHGGRCGGRCGGQPWGAAALGQSRCGHAPHRNQPCGAYTPETAVDALAVYSPGPRGVSVSGGRLSQASRLCLGCGCRDPHWPLPSSYLRHLLTVLSVLTRIGGPFYIGAVSPVVCPCITPRASFLYKLRTL